MKPVFLVTCYNQKNYGSVLQAFATQEFLNANSVPNQTVNTSGISNIIKKRKMAYFKRNVFSRDVLLDKAPYLWLNIHKKLNSKLRSNIQARDKLFDEFAMSKFHLTESFSNFDELACASAKRAEAVLVGSDQLWLPTNIEADYTTLNFVPEEITKISFATSFGIAELPKIQAEKAAKFLKRFNYLSVREQSGYILIEKLIHKSPTLVCDPVLLITAQQWRNYITKNSPPEHKYIFCYLLGKERSHYRWAKELAEYTGLKIIAFTNLDTYIKLADEIVDVPYYNASPFELISLIANAEHVCTDSFHATVFSLMFHKQVYTFKRFTKKTAMSTNGRLESLYKLFENDKPFINADTPIESAIESTPNHCAVDKAFSKLREISVNFLSEALNVKLH